MNVAELEQDVRERINRPRMQRALMEKTAGWNTVCSALDIIGDTEMALSAYLSHPKVEEPGLRYLFVYGAFQLLQSQQGAVQYLCNALSVKTKTKPKISRITALRSTAVAHPTSGRENNAHRAGFIQRVSLTHAGFTLMTVYSDSTRHKHEHVNLPELIANQRAVLGEVLSEVIEMLDEDENKHRETFREKKLVEAFPDTLGYDFSKICEAARDPSYFPLGAPHLHLVEKSIDRFREMLQERGLWGAYVGVDSAYEELAHPLKELKNFFADPNMSRLVSADIPVFAKYLSGCVDDLRSIAESIDEEYEAQAGAGD
jgi:hypothetical protein